MSLDVVEASGLEVHGVSTIEGGDGDETSVYVGGGVRQVLFLKKQKLTRKGTDPILCGSV
jgi:hypothetical protein